MISSDDLRRDAQPVPLTQVPPAQIKRMRRRIHELAGLHIEEDNTRDEEEAVVLLFQHIQ